MEHALPITSCRHDRCHQRIKKGPSGPLLDGWLDVADIASESRVLIRATLRNRVQDPAALLPSGLLVVGPTALGEGKRDSQDGNTYRSGGSSSSPAQMVNCHSSTQIADFADEGADVAAAQRIPADSVRRLQSLLRHRRQRRQWQSLRVI